MPASARSAGFLDLAERIGRRTVAGVAEIGFAAMLLVESLVWAITGHARRQPVRLAAIVEQMMEIGVMAIPIVSVLSITIGVMLAIQGIYTLRAFGAEEKVTLGVALSVTREFAPLITGILVAGRSGSALAARIGTMSINQEVDALTVMGINPVRFLVAPPLFAMMVMLPALTIYADLVALFGAGLYIGADLGMSMSTYFDRVVEALSINDVMHGIGKSVIFAALVALIGVVNGASVSGGAEGVGRVTTRAVVQGISAIVITDMIFAFAITR
ncbi:MAG: ABC transporter permease [Acetobacterales bacterium]